MRSTIAIPVVLAIASCAHLALAQDPPQQLPPPEPAASDTPREHVGFQMALRTGYSIPFGKASGSNVGDMSNIFTGQVPIYVDIGGKPIPNLFLGGYFGLGFGGATGDVGRACDTSNLTCVAVGVRFGVEAQYHVLPAGKVNPWIGYGIGFESIAVAMSDGNQTQSISDSGIEFAHFTAGVDARLSRVFGIGGFVGLSVGQYNTYSQRDDATNTTVSGDIENTGTHEWFTIGVRTVFFP